MTRRAPLVPLVLTLVIVLAFAVTASTAYAATSFNPVADAYVDGSKPTNNYGARAELRTDASPYRAAYLRFNVQGVTDFSSARLRIYVETGSRGGFEVREVTDDTWGESTLTFNNKPNPSNTVVWNSGPVSAGSWVNADVSSLVTQGGLVSFALTSTDTTAMRLTSREGTKPPELIVPAPAPTTRFVVSREGSTYTAESVPSGTTYSGSLKSALESAVVDLDTAGGGTVSFEAGTFDFGSEFFNVHQIHNITFEGQGEDVTFIQNSSNAAADTEPFNLSGAFHVAIRDMTISAGGSPRTTSDAIDFDQGNDSLVERVKITSSRARGIVFDGKNTGWTADRNTVRDCVITGNIPSRGIQFLASSDNLVENCDISNTQGHGIQIVKSSTVSGQPNKQSSNNVLRGNTIDGAGQDGINVISGDGNRIVGNTVTNSARDGIRIDIANSVSSDDNIVENNVATDNQPQKTQVYGLNIANALCNRTIVTDNTFTGNKTGDIRDLGTGTVITSNDTEAPAPPPVLSGNAATAFSVDLSWTASDDNVGVTAYTVDRSDDGGASWLNIATVDGSTLSYQDTTVEPGFTYQYRVDAVDAAGNSTQSNIVELMTPPPPPGVTLNPEADSYVNASNPGSNYGNSTQLRTDASPEIRSYLRFDAPLQGPVTSATLRVHASSNLSAGFEVRAVSDNGWGEDTITFANAPQTGSLIAASGPVSAGSYVDVDVTGYVTGSGLYSFALTPLSNTNLRLDSRENATPPELVVEG